MPVGVKPILPCKSSSTPKTADSTADTSPVIISEPLKRSINPISTFADLAAMSAAIIAASEGVMVKMPMAPHLSSNKPSFLYKLLTGFAIMCASVICLPGTYSCTILCFVPSSLISSAHLPGYANGAYITFPVTNTPSVLQQWT